MKKNTISNELNIATIADIHFGATDDSRILYKELTEMFIKPLLTNIPDLIVLLGDLYDKKYTLNSEAAIYCNKFMSDLKTLFPNTIIAIIHGTLSHDYMQLDSFNHYISDNFRIYKEATVDYIKGMKILFIPEEYLSSKVIYTTFMEDTYDFVFGHGMFNHVGVYANMESVKKNKIVFTYKDFENKVKGVVNFGHIHKQSDYKNIIYNGSFTRYSFGEEEAKGYYTYRYDVSKRKLLDKTFVENILAPKYDTVAFETLPNNKNDFTNSIIETLKNCYKLRVKVEDIQTSRENNYHDLVAISKRNDKLIVFRKLKPTKPDAKISERELHIENEIKKYKDDDWFSVTIKFAKHRYDIELTKEDILEAIQINE